MLAIPINNAAAGFVIPKVNAALTASSAQTFGTEASCRSPLHRGGAQLIGEEVPYDAQAVCKEWLPVIWVRRLFVFRVSLGKFIE